VPAWDAKTKEWVRQGKLAVLGIAQEQHADRCRLFAQWHQLDWPILHDPINVMQVTGVPIEVAIDERGIVRSLRPQRDTFEQEFLNRQFARDETSPPEEPHAAVRPDVAALRRRAEQGGSPEAWRDLGDALVLWAGPGGVNEAIGAYTRALQAQPDDAVTHFRLGVCYRIRCESEDQRPGDFQTAVDHWMTARSLRPNQYIWRRRIEQYGPRLTKPYPFYDWVQTAAREIRARGDQPVELKVLPTGSETAGPAREWEAGPGEAKPPDPEGRIDRDTQGLVLADVTVVPARVKVGATVRVHMTLRPNGARKAHWSNEGEPLHVWVDLPSGWRAQPQLLVFPNPEHPTSSEPRHVELELRPAPDAGGPSRLGAYALYYVCEEADGTCRFLRQDIPLTIAVDK
jgi:hypothetical protein